MEKQIFNKNFEQNEVENKNKLFLKRQWESEQYILFVTFWFADFLCKAKYLTPSEAIWFDYKHSRNSLLSNTLLSHLSPFFILFIFPHSTLQDPLYKKQRTMHCLLSQRSQKTNNSRDKMQNINECHKLSIFPKRFQFTQQMGKE